MSVKESFYFKWCRPCMDWYEEVPVDIKEDDFYYFRIERRYGPSWWLIGMKPKDKPKHDWEHTEIGEIREWDLRRFIEWAKSGKGSKIIEVKSMSSDFNIIEDVMKVLPKEELA